MSAPTNAADAKADTKRGRSSEADASESTQPDAPDRSVRQRIELSAVLSAPAPSSAAASAAVSLAAVSPTRSFMRLAVVERQQIMQGLDLTSLARLASTCSQLRAEALHREAGKFIPPPTKAAVAESMCVINCNDSAHASALVRAHLPVTLDLKWHLTLGQLQPLMNKAAHFSRITTLDLATDRWLESRMLHFLALPWIQGVKRVTVGLNESNIVPCAWLLIPAVQRAVFALPSLTSMEIGVASHSRLLKSAIVQAAKLECVHVRVDPRQARSIRALSAAPSLTDLRIEAPGWEMAVRPFRQFIWCLPPTLQSLTLADFNVREAAAPRAVLKTFFQRAPMLQCLTAERMAIAPLIQGMLDAGLSALPELGIVEFVGCDHDELRPELVRRFLHRFPAVDILFVLSYPYDPETIVESHEFSALYANWPRIEIQDPQAADPPSPHRSDDDSGSEVDCVSDPGSEPEEEQY